MIYMAEFQRLQICACLEDPDRIEPCRARVFAEIHDMTEIERIMREEPCLVLVRFRNVKTLKHD